MPNGVAALASGGLDSSVMLWELTKKYEEVIPIYIRCGLYWEDVEQSVLKDFLVKLGNKKIREVQILDVPMLDVYGDQWYMNGEKIPGYHEPDEHWDIPGRNIMLIAKTAIWCKVNGIDKIAMASLTSNPFPDATRKFIAGFTQRTTITPS